MIINAVKTFAHSILATQTTSGTSKTCEVVSVLHNSFGAHDLSNDLLR